MDGWRWGLPWDCRRAICAKLLGLIADHGDSKGGAAKVDLRGHCEEPQTLRRGVHAPHPLHPPQPVTINSDPSSSSAGPLRRHRVCSSIMHPADALHVLVDGVGDAQGRVPMRASAGQQPSRPPPGPDLSRSSLARSFKRCGTAPAWVHHRCCRSVGCLLPRRRCRGAPPSTE